MSIETDFRALLAGHAALTALVGTRIAQSAVADGAGLPAVVFETAHTFIDSTDTPRLADRAAISVQCWAETSASAASVAAAVLGAIDTASASHAARVLDTSTTFDAETGLDGVVINLDWWA